MSAKEVQAYTDRVWEETAYLDGKGWSPAGIHAYVDYVNQAKASIEASYAHDGREIEPTIYTAMKGSQNGVVPVTHAILSNMDSGKVVKNKIQDGGGKAYTKYWVNGFRVIF